MPELIEEVFNQIYINSLECNGIHGVDFIRHKKSGNVIKIMDYLKLDNATKREYKRIKHLGIKQEIKKNVWILCLFTTSKVTQMNEFMVNNTILTNNFHQYINYPIIVENSTLCEYFIFHSDLTQFPEYCKNYITLSSKDMDTRMSEIMVDAIKGYKTTLYSADFQNPLSILDSLYKHYEGRQDIFMNYDRDTKHLRHLEITNDDLINFIDNVFEGKNIHGEDMLKKSINEIKSNNKIMM